MPTICDSPYRFDELPDKTGWRLVHMADAGEITIADFLGDDLSSIDSMYCHFVDKAKYATPETWDLLLLPIRPSIILAVNKTLDIYERWLEAETLAAIG